MKVLKFELYGDTAFFKNPSVNANTYLTFQQIHKIVLFGMLGSIMGYGGYIKQKNDVDKNKENKKNKVYKPIDTTYPEFYSKFKDFKISVVPNSEFTTTITNYTNTIGYANKCQTLLVREQWLENVSWTIFIKKEDNEIYEKLKDRLFNEDFVYPIYFGNTSHFANIKDVKEIDIEEIDDENVSIDSLFFGEDLDFGLIESSEKEFFEICFLPIAMSKEDNRYIYEKFFHTNLPVKSKNIRDLYKYKDNVLKFI